MIRVLQIFGSSNPGGAETLITSILENINREDVMFDFLILDNHIGALENKWKELGSNIYHIRKYNILNAKSFKNEFNSFLSKHKNEWDYIHVNTELSGPIICKIAKENNIKSIAHSHSASSGKGIKGLLRKIEFKKFSKGYGDILLACSTPASKIRFGNRSKEAIILNNSINLNDFIFNENTKNELRIKYNIPNNAFVIGHVGRFDKVKNHEFLIKLFFEYHKQNNNAYLVLVGDGVLKEKCQNLVNKLNLEKNVIFTGLTFEVYKYYNMFDLFIMPSLFEGIPLAGIEAQANGLPLLLSDTIDRNVKLNENVKFISLTNLFNWVDEIPNMKRANISSNLSSYDIKNIAEQYKNLLII